MKTPFKQIKTNDKFHGKKKSGFVDSGFVKTRDELVIEEENEVTGSKSRSPSRSRRFSRARIGR